MESKFARFVTTHGSTIFLFVILSASLTLNVVLGVQLRSASTSPRSVGISEDVRVPNLPVFDTAGTELTLNLVDRRPTVLYIFSPSCIWCSRNLANINALATAKGAAFRFIGLSNNDRGFREYAEAKNLAFPVFVVNGKGIAQSADVTFIKGLGATPQTLVVGADGVVERAWSGAYGSEVQREVERYFGVSLPGLVDVRSSSSPAGE